MNKPSPARIALVATIGLGSTLAAARARTRRQRANQGSRIAPWTPLIEAGRNVAARKTPEVIDLTTAAEESPIEIDSEISLNGATTHEELKNAAPSMTL